MTPTPAGSGRLRADALSGFHGPASRMWRVNREAVLLGAGPAALLLQIAHPLVAEGVAAHSDFRRDPFGRLRRTLSTTLDIIFGDGATAEAAVARLNAVHATVRGAVEDPRAVGATGARHYRALDPELLLWVQSTLIITSVAAYRSWVGPLRADDCEALWQEARPVGERLGIPISFSPRTWTELESWFAEQLRPSGPISVTPTARSLAPSILRPPLPFVPGPALDLMMLPGLSLLPPRLRREFGIEWSPSRRTVARGLALGVRSWVTIMPRGARAMPQALAAERRVARAA